MKGYYNFKIFEPKEREVYATYYPDRVVLHCVCDEVLVPLLQKRVIYDNAACQPGKGTHFAIGRLNKFMREHYKVHGANGYFLKCDIKKYFASLDHAVLKNMLSKLPMDSDTCDLLFGCVDSFSTPDTMEKGITNEMPCGVPLGNQTSQWFGVYYLNCVDRFIKEKLRVKHYIRYMDDMLLLHHDKAYLQDCLTQIRQMVEHDFKLILNERTQIFPMKNGVNFLGWRFYLTETGKVIRKMKSQSKLRYKRRIKKLKEDYASGAIDLERFNNCIASYRGHLDYGHTYKLKAHVMGTD